MTFTAEQNAALSGPLDKTKVKERSQAGRQLSYIEAWHAIAEANRIFGYDMWDRETVTLTETNRDLVDVKAKDGSTYQQWRVGYMAKVKVTAYTTTGGRIVREGSGFGSGMSKPEAIGEAVESAVKEAESDAMKRALMTFGNPFGLALYDKTQANVVDPDANRLHAAEAKRQGLNDQIKKELAEVPDLETLGVWGAQRLPHWLARCPRSWEDPINDFYLNRREELMQAAHEGPPQ